MGWYGLEHKRRNTAVTPVKFSVATCPMCGSEGRTKYICSTLLLKSFKEGILEKYILRTRGGWNWLRIVSNGGRWY
jgi:hypothetical protein